MKTLLTVIGGLHFEIGDLHFLKFYFTADLY